MTTQSEAHSEETFYIPARGALPRTRRVLKNEDTLCLLDTLGDVGVVDGSDGLFHKDTRFLHRLELALDRAPPALLGFQWGDDNALLTVDLSNPDVYKGTKIVQERNSVHLVRSIFLSSAAMHHRVAATNHSDGVTTSEISFAFDADFADVLEVQARGRGFARSNRGAKTSNLIGNEQVVFSYTGLDNVVRKTVLIFDPPPTRLTESSALYRLILEPRKVLTLFATIYCDPQGIPKPVSFFKSFALVQNDLWRKSQRGAVVETSSVLFNEVLQRAMSDLHMLTTSTPQGLFPYAGLPWHSATLAREGLLVALEVLWLMPEIARGVLGRLAAYQGKSTDSATGAEPGRILDELRTGEMATLRELPFGLHYRNIDSTPLFVLLAGLYSERVGDDSVLSELWPAIEAALSWIDGFGDLDGDGFVEYREMDENEAEDWAHPQDKAFHSNGRRARGPIAPVEVQGYVYAAKRTAAKCAERLGYPRRAADLDAEAEKLAEDFDSAFWCPELDNYAAALDGMKRPCRTRSSGTGQLLFTGIVPVKRAAKLATTLLRPHFFGGWGIRTVSGIEFHYNPMSYRSGSVWPHENAFIALGLARCGFKDGVERLFNGLFDVATSASLYRVPELFCGFQRRRGRGPTPYPEASSPHSPATGALLLMLQSLLGLEFNSRSKRIVLREPRLPPFIDEMTIRNLRLGASTIDVSLYRLEDRITARIIRGNGDVAIETNGSAINP